MKLLATRGYSCLIPRTRYAKGVSLTSSFETELLLFFFSLTESQASKDETEAEVGAGFAFWFFSSSLAPAVEAPDNNVPPDRDNAETLSSSIFSTAFLGFRAFKGCPDTAHQARLTA